MNDDPKCNECGGTQQDPVAPFLDCEACMSAAIGEVIAEDAAERKGMLTVMTAAGEECRFHPDDATISFGSINADLRQQLADVSHERDLLRSAQGWISVFDRLPEDVRPVLVFGSTKSSSVLRAIPSWTDGDYWYETESEEYMEIVTHWMPLPAAPSAEVKS